MFRKMPFFLLAIILFVIGMGDWIPQTWQSALYALSLTIKSVIVFLLPLVIFSLLFQTAVNFSHKASKMFLLILTLVCFSNFFSTLLSYSVGTFTYQLDLSIIFPGEEFSLVPLWNLTLPTWIGNAYAMFLGIILGILMGWKKPLQANVIAFYLNRVVKLILRGILLIIPFFITGFVIKMHHDQVMTYILSHYSIIFLIVATAAFAYIILLYFAVSKCHLKNTLHKLNNMLPAAIAGFGSMSSAAAMPLTILGTEKNGKDANLAGSTIPLTVNIHLIGDCFAIPIFAFAVLKSFGLAEPAFTNYLIFAFYFVLAKFSVAAVPGGGILVMLPILETYLGFNADMLSLITALYILFDSVITCANVLGNGGFALLVDVLVGSMRSKKNHFELK